MKVVIAGGGTGGHVFPAISIAEEILERDGKNEILFVGTKHGMEKKILPERGYRVEFINSGGIVGKSFVDKAKAMVSVLSGTVRSLKILRRFRPDAVVGVGGYASVPTVLGAFMSFLPTAVCEQNSVPGLANRILSRFVGKIFITFEESAGHLPEGKTILTGNPIRRELAKRASEKKTSRSDTTRVFVLGGSQGARILNETVPAALAGISRDLTVTHQTGEADREMVEKAYAELEIRARVFEFTKDISSIYEETDIVVCRSGAGALSEVTAFGIPSVLIPLASSTHGHQLENARFMEKNDAAVVMEEKDLDSEKLGWVLEKTFEPRTLERMAVNSKKLGRPEAAQKIVDQIEEMAS